MCLRISTDHNLVLHEGRSGPPLISLISIWIYGLYTSIYAVFLQEASCFKVFQLKFFYEFFPAKHAACSFHLILLDLIALGLIMYEEKSYGILECAGLFYENLV
jgi:hypothetical protein